MIALLLLLAAVDGGSAGRFGPDGGFHNPVDVKCDFARMEGAKQQLVCTGHVLVKRYNTDITCQKLIAYYTNRDVNDMTHFECIGDVVAVDDDRWATGDFGNYDNVTEVLVMTGNPRGRQGTNLLEGEQITFHVNSDQMDVTTVNAILESQGQEERRAAKKKKAASLPLGAPDAGPLQGEFVNPANIQCDRGRMEGSKEQMVCLGHVHVKRHNTLMTCERAIAYYVNKDVNEVKRIECTGNVEAVDGNRWARGDVGDFDTTKEVLVMTGHPQGRQGTNEMTGTKITFYVDSDLMDVDNAIGVLDSKGQDEKRKANMKKAAPPK
ncbi:MAG: LptA/OstA family protein [Myxococcaceae bacterium]